MFETVQYDLTRISYGRRGTVFYVGQWKEDGVDRLYVCALLNGLDTASGGHTPRSGKLFPIKLERDGQEIPYRAAATPVNVTLEYEGGSARITLQEGSILRMEASDVTIVLSPDLRPHEIAKTRNDGSWEVIMNPVPKMLFCPVIGEMEVVTGFDVINSIPEDTRFIFTPDANGKVDLAVHLYNSNGWRMDKYPDFDVCLASVEQEFTAYLETAPNLPEQYETARTLEAYIVWSHIIPIDGIDIIYMNKGPHRMTSSWQQSYHAMGQYKNPRYAWELMLSVFHYQDDFGMLPDLILDSSQNFGGCKPPFQGVALECLKKYTDFSFAPRKECNFLYDGLSKWVFWWLSFRDTDHDGILQYDTADESGWDDSSFFREGGPMESPDLATYMILAMDSLADLAGRLGKSYEQREWKRRADEMLANTLSFFWNGEMFAPRKNSTHEWVENGSIMSFIPLLLGKRLPQEIIDKTVASLSREGVWLTPYGLSGEKMGSDHFHLTGWSAGPVLAPSQMLVCLGLHACGQDDLAKTIATRYCKALINAGFPMVMNPATGEDVSEGRWSTRYPNRMAWTAMIFLLLGSMYLD
jgi:hypothetical protein